MLVISLSFYSSISVGYVRSIFEALNQASHYIINIRSTSNYLKKLESFHECRHFR